MNYKYSARVLLFLIGLLWIFKFPAPETPKNLNTFRIVYSVLTLEVIVAGCRLAFGVFTLFGTENLSFIHVQFSDTAAPEWCVCVFAFHVFSLVFQSSSSAYRSTPPLGNSTWIFHKKKNKQ